MDGRRCRATTGWTRWTTVHLWTQVIGKIRMVQSPVDQPLVERDAVRLAARAADLPRPVRQRGLRVGVRLRRTPRRPRRRRRGQHRTIPLAPMTVADFYAMVLDAMDAVGMPVTVNPMPNEIPDAIPFHDDTVARCLPTRPRSTPGGGPPCRPTGSSPGSAPVTGARPVRSTSSGAASTWQSRGSPGGSAPPHAGGVPNFPDDVAREAYSHEVTSAGFWPGDAWCSDADLLRLRLSDAGGLRRRRSVSPAEAFWLAELGEFALPYDAVATADDPDAYLMSLPRVDTRRSRRPRRMGSGSARVRRPARPGLVADPSQPSVRGFCP